jgi:hypothetical protein
MSRIFKIICLFLLCLQFSSCSDVEINAKNSNVDNSRHFAKWVFYSVHYKIDSYRMLCADYHKIITANLIDLNLTANEIVLGDTVVFIFSLTDLKNGCKVEPFRWAWYDKIIISTFDFKIIGVMDPYSDENDYFECLSNFDRFNLNENNLPLPTGQDSPFPIHKSMDEFYLYLKNIKDLENRNEWLYKIRNIYKLDLFQDVIRINTPSNEIASSEN